jgi:hypothetical protein
LVSYDEVVVEVELYPDTSMRSEPRELYCVCLSTGDCAPLLCEWWVSNNTNATLDREMPIELATTYG